MKNSNPCTSIFIEFHILQSFPVTCLNRDDVGAPKSAIVGGVPRARVSSQCWKRQVRLSLHDLGVNLGIRTKQLGVLISQACERLGAESEKANQCGEIIASSLAKDTLLFVSTSEIERLASYAKEKNFIFPVEVKKNKKDDEGSDAVGKLSKPEMSKLKACLNSNNKAADGLDIALFGRMVAQEPSVNIQAAAAFSHAITTHKVANEVEFFTALDDLQQDPGAAHMGSLEYNSGTYYRYISLDLGQLWENLGGCEEDIKKAIDVFVKALYIAVPSARQNTQSGSCLWDYARILVRRGQRMQLSFDSPVRSCGKGWLAPSIEALNKALDRNEKLSGSLYGKIADVTFGDENSMSIDELCKKIVDAVPTAEQL